MPYSSGTFTLVAGNPVVTGTTISSAWANNTLSDIATGLSTCILKDGTQTLAANLPMAGYKLTGLAAGSANGDSLRFEQAASLGQNYIGSVAGTANAITGTTTVAAALAAGQLFSIVPASTNTGATTLALNAGAAVDVFANAAACQGGELVASVPALLEYDGTRFNIVANGSSVLLSLIAAKGDLLTGSAARSAIKTTAGADGTILGAASAQAGGVSWNRVADYAAVTTIDPINDSVFITSNAAGANRRVSPNYLLGGVRPAFSAQAIGGQSIPATSFAAVQFGNTNFDTNANYDNTTYRFTPTVAGFYMVLVTATIASINAGKVFAAAIYKNGGMIAQSTQPPPNVVAQVGATAVALVQMNGTTDYLQGYAYNGDAAPQSLVAVQGQNSFAAFRII